MNDSVERQPARDSEGAQVPEQKLAYTLSFSDVIRVLRLVDETPFRELQLELDGLKIHLVQDKEAPATQAAAPPALSPVAETVSGAPAAPLRDPDVAAPVQAAALSTEGTPVFAPLAGTFYRAPAPGAAPFVEVGAAVKEGDVVGILEIMKLMNHITAPCTGTIAEIRAKNEEFVEFGQVLAVINPARPA